MTINNADHEEEHSTVQLKSTDIRHHEILHMILLSDKYLSIEYEELDKILSYLQRLFSGHMNELDHIWVETKSKNNISIFQHESLAKLFFKLFPLACNSKYHHTLHHIMTGIISHLLCTEPIFAIELCHFIINLQTDQVFLSDDFQKIDQNDSKPPTLNTSTSLLFPTQIYITLPQSHLITIRSIVFSFSSWQNISYLSSFILGLIFDTNPFLMTTSDYLSLIAVQTTCMYLRVSHLPSKLTCSELISIAKYHEPLKCEHLNSSTGHYYICSKLLQSFIPNYSFFHDTNDMTQLLTMLSLFPQSTYINYDTSIISSLDPSPCYSFMFDKITIQLREALLLWIIRNEPLFSWNQHGIYAKLIRMMVSNEFKSVSWIELIKKHSDNESSIPDERDYTRIDASGLSILDPALPDHMVLSIELYLFTLLEHYTDDQRLNKWISVYENTFKTVNIPYRILVSIFRVLIWAISKGYAEGSIQHLISSWIGHLTRCKSNDKDKIGTKIISISFMVECVSIHPRFWTLFSFNEHVHAPYAFIMSWIASIPPYYHFDIVMKSMHCVHADVSWIQSFFTEHSRRYIELFDTINQMEILYFISFQLVCIINQDKCVRDILRLLSLLLPRVKNDTLIDYIIRTSPFILPLLKKALDSTFIILNSSTEIYLLLQECYEPLENLILDLFFRYIQDTEKCAVKMAIDLISRESSIRVGLRLASSQFKRSHGEHYGLQFLLLILKLLDEDHMDIKAINMILIESTKGLREWIQLSLPTIIHRLGESILVRPKLVSFLSNLLEISTLSLFKAQVTFIIPWFISDVVTLPKLASAIDRYVCADDHTIDEWLIDYADDVIAFHLMNGDWNSINIFCERLLPTINGIDKNLLIKYCSSGIIFKLTARYCIIMDDHDIKRYRDSIQRIADVIEESVNAFVEGNMFGLLNYLRTFLSHKKRVPTIQKKNALECMSVLGRLLNEGCNGDTRSGFDIQFWSIIKSIWIHDVPQAIVRDLQSTFYSIFMIHGPIDDTRYSILLASIFIFRFHHHGNNEVIISDIFNLLKNHNPIINRFLSDTMMFPFLETVLDATQDDLRYIEFLFKQLNIAVIGESNHKFAYCTFLLRVCKRILYHNTDGFNWIMSLRRGSINRGLLEQFHDNLVKIFSEYPDDDSECFILGLDCLAFVQTFLSEQRSKMPSYDLSDPRLILCKSEEECNVDEWLCRGLLYILKHHLIPLHHSQNEENILAYLIQEYMTSWKQLQLNSKNEIFYSIMTRDQADFLWPFLKSKYRLLEDGPRNDHETRPIQSWIIDLISSNNSLFNQSILRLLMLTLRLLPNVSMVLIDIASIILAYIHCWTADTDQTLNSYHSYVREYLSCHDSNLFDVVLRIYDHSFTHLHNHTNHTDGYRLWRGYLDRIPYKEIIKHYSSVQGAEHGYRCAFYVDQLLWRYKNYSSESDITELHFLLQKCEYQLGINPANVIAIERHVNSINSSILHESKILSAISDHDSRQAILLFEVNRSDHRYLSKCLASTGSNEYAYYLGKCTDPHSEEFKKAAWQLGHWNEEYNTGFHGVLGKLMKQISSDEINIDNTVNTLKFIAIDEHSNLPKLYQYSGYIALLNLINIEQTSLNTVIDELFIPKFVDPIAKPSASVIGQHCLSKDHIIFLLKLSEVVDDSVLMNGWIRYQLVKRYISDGCMDAAWKQSLVLRNKLCSTSIKSKELAILSNFSALQHAKLIICGNGKSIESSKRQALDYLKSVILQDTSCISNTDGTNGPLSPHNTILAKIKRTMATLMVEEKLFEPTEIFSMFQQSIQLDCNQEKTFYHLAKYQLELSQSSEHLPTDTSSIKTWLIQACKSFSKTVLLGQNDLIVTESIHKLFSIWFKTAGQQTESSPFEQIHNDVMLRMLKRLEPHKLMKIISQLISRILFSNPTISNTLDKIIIRLFLTFPHQTIWHCLPVLKSSILQRKKRAHDDWLVRIMSSSSSEALSMIQDTLAFADGLIQLANYQSPVISSIRTADNPMNIHDTSLGGRYGALSKWLVNGSPDNKCSVPLPRLNWIQSFSCSRVNDDRMVTIHSIEEKINVMPSLQRPKRIVMMGSDGNRYVFLCKPKDDLRKDARFMEVAVLLNRLLSKHKDSELDLYMRPYGVYPLNEECGILEWVPNLIPYRQVLLDRYEAKGIPTSNRQLRDIINLPMTPKEIYLNHLLPRFPSVFYEWFYEQFPFFPHQSLFNCWYNARLCYTKTMAVMSIFGYVMGLGDRHGENILLDMKNGDCVHVDFNCLFEKGLTFEKPELVPFRLTHNMVDAMHPVLGYDGAFRKSCEMTMSILRKYRDLLLFVLETFIYDPLVEWQTGSSSKQKKKNGSEIENEEGKKTLSVIDSKLKGFISNGNIQLSVYGQVDYLIREATSTNNLSQMYVGWAPFM